MSISVTQIQLKKNADDPVIKFVIAEIKVYRGKQAMGQLGHPSLLSRHWEELYKILINTTKRK